MRVVIVGAGLAGRTLLENLKLPNSKIYLIEKKEKPFKKHLLIEWLAGKVSDSDFFFPLEDLEKNPSLELIRDRAIRVNFEKKRLFLKSSQPLEFDKLVISSGLRAKRLVFGGVYKEGVYYLGEEPLKLKQDLSIYPHIIIYAQTLLGVKLGNWLLQLKKKVKIVTPQEDILLKEDLKEMIFSWGEEVLYPNLEIEEALGEGRVRAVKLSSGKFLACDVLIIDSGYLANLSLLKDYPDLAAEALKVDEYLRMPFLDCFACGDVVNPQLSRQSFKNNKDLAQETARIVASNLLELKEKFVFSESKELPPGEGS